MYALNQGSSTIVDYYQAVHQQLSLTLNQIGNLDAPQEAIQSMTAITGHKRTT